MAIAPPSFRDAPPVTVVTGAGGWLGTALTTALLSEDRGLASRAGRVRVLVDQPADGARLAKLGDRIEVFVGDVRERADLDRVLEGAADADVIHAAAVIHPAKVEDFRTVNVEGTRQVIAAARAAGVRRLVHVSSNSPFGTNPTPVDTFRAEEPFNPYLGYGKSKMEAEVLAREADGEGIETTVVRPPWFYGPHQPARQTRFFTGIRTGRFPLVGDGSNRRSMAYVDNLVDGLTRAELAEGAAGRAYWVADRRPYPMREVVETVGEALRLEGYEVAKRIPRLPGIAGDVAERLDTVAQDKGRYIQELHVLGELNKTIACDISAAERDLGYDPQIELLEGMRRSIRWCREQGIEL